MEGQALPRAGPRLDEIQAALPALEVAVRPWPSSRPWGRASTAEDGEIRRRPRARAAAPAPGPCCRTTPPGYLAMLGRHEEALQFLSNMCGLAAQWLADICFRTLDPELDVFVISCASGFRTVGSQIVNICIEGQIVNICIEEHPTAESTVKFIADELGSNYNWKDINFKQATEDDMRRIQLALQD